MSSQNSSKPPESSSMNSLSKQVLQWQKELADYTDSQDDVHAKDTIRNDVAQAVPQILQDREIQTTLQTLVQVLTFSLPQANEPHKTFKDAKLVNASLEVLTKAAMQPTAKTLFVSTGALKPITNLLRKACLSQKFLVSNSPVNSAAAAAAAATTITNTSTTTIPSTVGPCGDEKKDDDGTTSSSPSSSSTSEEEEALQKTPSMALHCLANLSDNASDAIKNDYLLPIANPLVHNIMSSATQPQIQRYACKMVYHLSNPLLQELVAAGFVEVIWKANQAHPDDAILQHYANACLYNLLPVCPPLILQQIARPQQMVQGLVTGMMAHPTNLEVQKYGLLVMTRVATNNVSQNHRPGAAVAAASPNTSPTATATGGSSSFLKSTKQPNNNTNNALQASHALGLPHVIYCILTALHLHCKNDEIAQVGCNLLKHVSRISIDFANAMIQEGGLAVLLRIMQCHLDHTSIQDPCMATLRNLLSLRTTTAIGIVDTTLPEEAAKSIRLALQEAKTSSGNTNNGKQQQQQQQPNGEPTLVAMVRVIGLVMSIHVQDAPIQAYGCDAFGRLAALDDYAVDSPGDSNSDSNNNNNNNNNATKWIRQVLYEGNALRLALQAMRVHSNHLGVQDRAIVLLLRLCSYEPAYAFMRQEKEMEEESDEELELEDDYEYGDEYEDDSIGPVLQSSATGDSSNLSSSSQQMPQSFVYKILLNTKVSPRKESQDRLQRLLSIVDLQGLTPASSSSFHDSISSTREGGSGLFSRLSMEGASERMRNLRISLSSPTTENANAPTTAAATANQQQQQPQRASWASPLTGRASRWWQSPQNK